MSARVARYYDGVTPIPHAVTLTVAGPMLLIAETGGREIVRWLLSDLHVPPQDDSVGEAMILSRAQPDARLVVAGSEALALLLPHLPALASVTAPRRSSLKVWSVVAMLAVAVLGGSIFAVWRGPELVAPLVPQSWETGIGDLILDSFTGQHGRCVASDGTKALEGLAARLVAASNYKGPLQIVVVKNGLVNAFALPGGRIVLFDGLIQEATTPDEVAGVFAHELGHVVHLHPLRGLLRQLGLSFLRRMALGGYGDAVDTAAGLGETMLALRNGRDAEREADASALQYLATAGLRQDGLSEFFTRLARKGDAGETLGILSTHPPLAERRQSTRRPGEGEAALDHGQWQALRKVCSETEGGGKKR